MVFSKYIVPIYKGEEFSGTGFIVNGLLITANHVVDKMFDYYFYFDKSRYEINIGNLVVYEESKNEWMCPNIAQDLFICKSDIENSTLSFSSDYNTEQECYFLGYSFEEENGKLNKDIVEIKRISRTEALTKHYGKLITLNNCFSCQCNLVPGNSGGIITQNNQIIGMLIRGLDYYNGHHERTFIKASYIIQFIEKYTNK